MRAYVSTHRDVFRSPRSAEFDEQTESMLTLRRSPELLEPEHFHHDLFLVLDGHDDSGNGVGSQQWQARGQAKLAKAEAAQGQTTINQKVAAKMFKILL